MHDPENHKHPAILEPHMDEVNQTMHIIRENVLKKLLVLVAMILEVPEEAVLRTHAFGKESTEYLRYVLRPCLSSAICTEANILIPR